MGGWRRQKGDYHNQEVRRTRSQYKKPPLGNWQPTVPSWEKMFCSSVCSMTWEEILEGKKFMHLFENIVRWNDSAGEEAFNNAKHRFYAKMHGLPCDISLPDPDIYIDNVNWDSKIDPQLLLDLEREPVYPNVEKREENAFSIGNFILSSQEFACAGWGEIDEELGRANETPRDNSDNINRDIKYSPGCLGNDAQERDCIGSRDYGNGGMGTNRWQVGRNSASWGRHRHNNTNYERFHVQNQNNSDWGLWDNDNVRPVDTYGLMLGHRTSRFHGNENRRSHGWMTGKARMKGNVSRNWQQQFKAPLEGNRP